MPTEHQPSGQKLPLTHNAELLASATNAGELGGQQFFTRPEFAAALVEPLTAPTSSAFADRRMICADLTGAGDGTLLDACRKRYGNNYHGYGIDIDPRFRSQGVGTGIRIDTADTTRLAPLLAKTHFTANIHVINPPYSLNWHSEHLHDMLKRSSVLAVADTWEHHTSRRGDKSATVDSTLASYLIALDRMNHGGEGLLITTWDSWQKHIAKTKAASHAWLTVRIPKAGHIFEPMVGDYDFAAIYFAREHRGGPERHIDSPESPSAENLHRTLSLFDPTRLRSGMATYPERDPKAKRTAWHAAVDEYTTRHVAGSTPDYNIRLRNDGTIATHLTPYQNLSGELPHASITELHQLDDETPMALVVQRDSRKALLRAVHNELWRVDPRLIEHVDQAVTAYNLERAPLYPLPEVQRLGYLDEEDSVTCTRSGIANFEAGRSYPIETKTEEAVYETTILDANGENNEVRRSGKELVLTLYTDDERNEATAHKFIIGGKYQYEITGTDKDNPKVHTFADFIDHFQVPEVEDIATLHPEQYQKNLEAVTKIETLINQCLT